MRDLAGHVALVTGSTSGIGEAVARRLASLGASVVVNSSSSAQAGGLLAQELGGECRYVQADISQRDQVEALCGTIEQSFGHLDILVNNAGWTSPVRHDDLDGLTDEIFRRTLEVNVFGTWLVTKTAMRLLRRAASPSVVMVSSAAGLRPRGSSIAYALSKAAINHLVALMAKSYRPVRFNAVAPSLVRTPWTEGWDHAYREVARLSPIGRAAEPDEIADAILALVTNAAINGAVLTVDGGITTVS